MKKSVLCLCGALVACALSTTACIYSEIDKLPGPPAIPSTGVPRVSEKVPSPASDALGSLLVLPPEKPWRDPTEVLLEPVREPVCEDFDTTEWDYVTITAYCGCSVCCNGWNDNRPIKDDGTPLVIGAAGVELVQGISVAVADVEKYPLGTVLEIYGVGTVIVHDSGCGWGEIDMYHVSHEDAGRFGVKTAWVRKVG